MKSKSTTNKLKFKYYFTKDKKYLVSDTLQTEYHFIENEHQGPELFHIKTEIEEIYTKITNAPNITEIYENYLSI